MTKVMFWNDYWDVKGSAQADAVDSQSPADFDGNLESKLAKPFNGEHEGSISR